MAPPDKDAKTRRSVFRPEVTALPAGLPAGGLVTCFAQTEKRLHMKHFGTDLIRDLKLYQSEGSRRFCHMAHTILCPLEGEIHVLAAGRDGSAGRTDSAIYEETFEAQGVLLIPCGRKVELVCQRPSSYLVLQLSPVFLMEAFSKDLLLSETITSAQYPELAQILPDLFQLVPLFRESPVQSRLEINRLLFSFLGSLDRILSARGNPAGSADPSLQIRQEAVDSYIAANIETQISLQETARACGLTPQYLSSFFQKSMNCTFMEYINRIKARKAHDWFLQSDLPPEEVCDIVGFKTYSAFCKSMEACYSKSWDALRMEASDSFCSLPEGDLLPNALPMMPRNASGGAADMPVSPEPVYQISNETIRARTRPDRILPGSWRTILNVGSADSIFFEPFLRKLNEFQQLVSFRYCRMYGLFQLVTVYVSGNKTYYGFELVFQNLDSIIKAGLIPFFDFGYRPFPGHRNPLSTFVFNSDPIDIYYEKLLAVLPEFLRAACNRYGREAVGQWGLEFHFSYQNSQNYTFWQFLTMFRKMEAASRAILPDVRIGGFGFDAALPEDTLQGMLEQVQSTGCRMDFISIHVNGLLLPDVSGSGRFRFTTDDAEPGRRVLAASGLIRGFFPDLPLYITEFGFAHFLQNALNDSLFQASFILRFIIENAGMVDGIGYHMMDDLGDYERPADHELYGGAGLYSTHGLRKPSYYAYSFLSRLGNSVLSVGRHHILTARSRFNYQLIAFHYRHIPDTMEQVPDSGRIRAFEKECSENGDRLHLHFQVSGAAPGAYMIKMIRMNPKVGSLHKIWLNHAASLNSLDEPDYAFFREHALPEASASPCQVDASGELVLDIMLAPLEVVLLLIDRHLGTGSI